MSGSRYYLASRRRPGFECLDAERVAGLVETATSEAVRASRDFSLTAYGHEHGVIRNLLAHSPTLRPRLPGKDEMTKAIAYGYGCFNCAACSPNGTTFLDMQIKALVAGWKIGHRAGQAENACPRCAFSLFDVLELTPDAWWRAGRLPSNPSRQVDGQAQLQFELQSGAWEVALETADCTLCASEPCDGFYPGCMVRDGHCEKSGWSCDGEGLLTRPVIQQPRPGAA